MIYCIVAFSNRMFFCPILTAPLFSGPAFSPLLLLSSPPSCFVELLQPYLEWKAWMMQILKAVSFTAAVTH